MKNEIGRILVLAGAAVLAIGVFLPLVSAPYIGSFTLVTSGNSPRVVMFATAIVALAFALVGWTRHALWPGLLALAAIGYGYWRVQDQIARLGERFGDGLAGGLARRATNLIQFEMGWAVIVLGALLVVIGAAIAWRWPPRPLPPAANRVMVVVGAVLVAVGVFLPLVHLPRLAMLIDVMGSEWPWVAMFIAALAALAFALVGWSRHALWPGLAATIALAVGYGQVLANIGQVQASILSVDERLGDGWIGRAAGKARDALENRYGEELLGKAAERATELIQLRWGWAVLVIGTVLILLGGAMAWLRRQPAHADLADLPPAAAEGSGRV